MTTTKQRKSTKPRSCRVLLPVSTGEVGLFRLTEGTKAEDYAVWTLDTDEGNKAFKMMKCGSPESESYDLELNADGKYSCECKGFLRWDHCKHGACLSKLAEVGKL